MATQSNIDKHDSIIQGLQDRFEEYIETASKTLEDRIADRVLASNTPEELIETRGAINNDFNELLDTGVKDFMNEFDEVGRDTISWTPGDVTDQDKLVVSELKKQSYNRLTEVGNATKESIHTEIMLGALAGVTVQTIAQSVRHKISGVFVTSTDLEIVKLQKKLKLLRKARDTKADEIAKTLGILKSKFKNVSVGGSLSVKANQEMHDLVMDFDAVFIKHRARQAGLKKFKYTGSLVAESRDFCIRNQGRTFTEEEAQRLWSSESWSGKRSGDPFVVRGGHRCRHFWVPVD